MKNTLETRLGLFVALIVIAAFFIMLIVGGFDRFQRGLHLRALFDTAQELKVGDPVKLVGVQIGRVEKIAITEVTAANITTNKDNTFTTNTLVTSKVEVTMKLNKGAVVRTDSRATIKFAGLMGRNFVSLDFGSPTNKAVVASDGTLIGSIEQPDLNSMITKLDNVASGVENLTKSFTGDKIDNLLGPFTDFLKQNSGPLTATIANLRATSGQMAEGKGTLGKLLYDESLYTTALTTVSNLQTTGDEIKLTIAEARKIIDGVNAGEGSLGKLVKDEKLYTETTTSMTNLKEILQKINQGQGTVGKLVNDQEFYKNARLTLQKLDKATEGLEDQGPLSVLGTMANSLF
jgi:phospholipid/cholesterol/gamma-HCH transport system substrate-binding protein